MRKIFLLSWFLLICFIGYGLLPVSINFKKFDFNKPNTLEIRYQVCGCPCPEAVIIKGKLQFSEYIKQEFPDLQEDGKEITLKNFPLFENFNANYDNCLCLLVK